MARKGGLGRGLDALIPGGDSPSEGSTTSVPIRKIQSNPRQPRTEMDEKELIELAASIREHGILQPLIVTYDPNQDVYILIAGERRLRAAAMIGLDAVPVIIRQATDQERLELALIENIQRSDLSPLEEAEAYHQLVTIFGLSHEEIALRVGKSRPAVTNTLRLLDLPAPLRKALADGDITEGHARALLGLPTSQAQIAALQTVLNLQLNVRQTEALVNKYKGDRPEIPPRKEPAPEIRALEQRLQDSLGTKVVLRHGRKGGSMIIHYYSDEELTALINRLVEE
ncbi:MAG TPA: ParB/RepB/Spo0J family partition protein [Anaerolineaceae bacterium]|nr:ParB/RepB/Spo0J family partition protein [Anaerolineaceae bacterium]HQO97907.1 ParB/RepB/Spo0J family partition protein [Anaerolineaceae bacterium]HQP61497.1 ParB/RepB/Spo0J family partition protein [Anaerolineaceae bacterium]